MVGEGWSLSQLAWSERWGRPWTGPGLSQGFVVFKSVFYGKGWLSHSFQTLWEFFQLQYPVLQSDSEVKKKRTSEFGFLKTIFLSNYLNYYCSLTEAWLLIDCSISSPAGTLLFVQTLRVDVNQSWAGGARPQEIPSASNRQPVSSADVEEQ